MLIHSAPLLLLLASGTAVTPTADTCADRAASNPEHFSQTLSACLSPLALGEVLQGARWHHERPEVSERARLVFLQQILNKEPVTQKEAPGLLALALDPAWAEHQPELLHVLASWPDGRAALAGALSDTPPGQLRLRMLLAYLHESGIEPCGRPDLAFGSKSSAGPELVSADEERRLTTYADEVRRAYLTERPFGGLDGADGFAERVWGVPSDAWDVKRECDAWLLMQVESKTLLPELGQSARALLSARIARGDPEDALLLLSGPTHLEWLKRGATPTVRAALGEAARQWILQLRPADLASVENQRRLCGFGLELKLHQGARLPSLPAERCPTQPYTEYCGTGYVDPDQTENGGSYADLRAFGLPVPPRQQKSVEPPPSEETEKKWRAAFEAALPAFQKAARGAPER